MSSSETSLVTTVVNIGLLVFRIQLEYLYSYYLRLTYLVGANKENTNWSNKEQEKESNRKEESTFINAKDITDIVQASGYIVREHVVTTEDGYILVIHQLEKPGVIHVEKGKIAYFHHGMLTNSELFVLGSEKNKSLPYLLLDLGYEVWLGNNRGNKYSRKHLKLSVTDAKFWDFSLDEFAYYDIPAILGYIKSFYRPEDKITYIGFSQGCSQLFASLSLHPYLNKYLNMFIALSPALIPKNLNHPVFRIIVDQTAKDSGFLYSLFGNRAIMSSVSFWSSIMGPKLYEKVVDVSLVYLFGWSGKNLSEDQKKLGYPHMFSNSSVKSLTHWFQIISAKRFQMFDETGKFGKTKLSILSTASKSKGHRVAPFPIAHHLDVPMVLFYGDSDILVDIECTKKLILDQNEKMASMLDVVLCPGYEHMDTLWASNVYEDVFSKVIIAIESHHRSRKNYSTMASNINSSLKRS
ncbi:triglyceride lipase-cholesterol esterase [Scheffersomyces xylosifermentans]|uniref:triglyceride lipase-cholesterol esterase n=1 Tax=Scheffersomyces xylosifermentans TaxID=1304137 RepID=UPI00315DC90D